MLRLADAENLDHGAMGAAVGGAVCVAVGSLLATSPVHVSLVDWVAWTGPLFIATGGSRGTWREKLKGALLGLSAVVGARLFGSDTVVGPGVAGAIVGFAVTEEASRRHRIGGTGPAWGLRFLAMGAGAIAWPLVLEAVGSIAGATESVTAASRFVIEAAAGGAFGLLMGMTAAPMHLESGGEPVSVALKRLRPTLDSELRALVLRIVEVRARALKLLDQSRADSDVRRETKRGLDGVALMAIELTDRFAAVDHVLSRMPLPGIDERAAHLRTQLEQAADPSVRRDLERALNALSDQRLQVERLLQSRQRLVARLQSELASLEKTEMSLALLISGDAAVAGLRLESIGSSLGRQAQELEAEGSALQEALTIGPAHVLERVGR